MIYESLSGGGVTIATAILDLINSGVRGGTALAAQHKALEAARAQAGSAVEAARIQYLLAETEREIMKLHAQSVSEQGKIVGNIAKYLTFGAAGIAAILALT